jgi:tetratricopeptide (TPR) repeat protein
MFGTLSTRKSAWAIGALACLTLLSVDVLATERPALPAKPPGAQAPDSVAIFHFMLGYQHELNNAAGEAEAEYLKAIALDPNSVAIHLRLATLYHARGEHDKADAHAEAALARDATNLQALHLLASVAMAAGRSEQAIELYKRIVALWPQEAQAYFSMGMLLSSLKRYDEAEQTIRRGNAVSQTAAPTGYIHLGHILAEQKAWDRAEQAYRDALAINPGFEPAYLGMAATLEAKGDTAQAIAVLRKVLQEVNKANREARQRLVRLLLTQKAYEPALALLREAVEESPDDVEAQLRIGLIYGELKDYVKAVEQIKLVLALRPQELRVRDHLAYLYEEMKDFDKAIAEYRTILKADERYSDAHLHLGYLLYRLKRNDEALPHFQQVIALNPKMTEAYLLLGLTLLQALRQEEAVAVFREGLQRNPGSADLHFNLGTAYDKMGRFDELVHEMEEAIRLDPKHADALNYLGYSYAERDMRLEEGVLLIQRALAVKPQNGYYLDSLAWAYYKMGRFQEALEEMKRAIAVVPDDPVFLEHLGEIYLTQNLRGEAREAWLRSLELDPTNHKLAERFKAKDFGDPATEERIQKSQQRLSNKAL